MEGMITISKGHDASYPWKQIGTAEPDLALDAKRGVGYYLAPAERGGEPPGIWASTGAAVPGLHPGRVAARAAGARLYARPRAAAGPQRAALSRPAARRAGWRRAG